MNMNTSADINSSISWYVNMSAAISLSGTAFFASTRKVSNSTTHVNCQPRYTTKSPANWPLAAETAEAKFVPHTPGATQLLHR
jgi:hypothetical protein